MESWNTMDVFFKRHVFASLAKTGAPPSIRKRILSVNMDVNTNQTQHIHNLWRQTKIFQDSTELMFWSSSSNLASFNFPELTESGRYRFSLGDNYKKNMQCVEFSNLSPDINPSVAKENTANLSFLHCTGGKVYDCWILLYSKNELALVRC